ncbi:MAG: tetratricopeptide repeat protein, partial [Deltaproteobacteria bacterium]|nr:tetratricopeptide repeat protein [Deltaproteobacteria bacterium]
MRTLLGIACFLCLTAVALPAVAQPIDESPTGDSPVDIQAAAEEEAAETEGAAVPVDETGPGAELRKAIERLKTDPAQLQQGSEVEAELVRLAGGSEPVIEAIYDLGVFYLRIGMQDKAASYFQQVLDRSPDFSEAMAQLGVLAALRNETAKALSLIDHALVIDKYCAPARNFLSQKALNEGNLDEAIKHCRIALLGDPNNMNAYLNMAIALFRKGQYDVGELVCESALRIDKNNATILNLMGLIQLKRDDIKGAITLFQAATGADATYIDAHKNLAAVSLNYKDFALAAKEFETILKVEPKNVEFQISYALALRGLENYPESRKVLSDIVNRDPGQPDARYNLCILEHEYVQDLHSALATCQEFQRRLDKKHPKFKEMELRVKGIRETIKAMEEMKKLEAER